MKVFLSCPCSARDEIPDATHERPRCHQCGDLMHAYRPPAWVTDRLSPPKKEGTAHV